MPSIQRPLSGDILVFDIDEERERAADPELINRSGRNARTLLKDGPLRVTLVVLGAAGELAEHEAAGPITVQVVNGRTRSARVTMSMTSGRDNSSPSVRGSGIVSPPTMEVPSS